MITRIPRTLGEGLAFGRAAGEQAGRASANAKGRDFWEDEDQEAADRATRAALQQLGIVDAAGEPTDLWRAAAIDPRAAWPAPLAPGPEALLEGAMFDIVEMQRASSFALSLPERNRERRRLERDVAAMTAQLADVADQMGLSLDEMLEAANARLHIKRVVQRSAFKRAA